MAAITATSTSRRTIRRQYIFPDRATAEAAVKHLGQVNDKHHDILVAIFDGRAETIRGGMYDACIAWPITDARDPNAAIIYHGRNLQQHASATVYSTDELRDWFRSIGLASLTPEEQELRGLLQKVLMAVDGWRRCPATYETWTSGRRRPDPSAAPAAATPA